MSHLNATAEVFTIIKDGVATGAIVLAGVAAYFALSRQLKLSSITELLKSEAAAKKELQKELQKQISFVSTAYNKWPPFLAANDLQDFVTKAQSIEALSSEARSEVANVCMLLRLSMQRVQRYYATQSHANPGSSIAWFYESALHIISTLNVKITVFPSIFSLIRFYEGRDSSTRILSDTEGIIDRKSFPLQNLEFILIHFELK